jgi:glutaredoxin 2
MTLYIEDGCAYSARVMEVIKELGLHPTLKNINDIRSRHELISRGGADQVPFLLDEEKGAQFYDSERIVQYLRATYGRSSHNTTK